MCSKKPVPQSISLRPFKAAAGVGVINARNPLPSDRLLDGMRATMAEDSANRLTAMIENAFIGVIRTSFSTGARASWTVGKMC